MEGRLSEKKLGRGLDVLKQYIKKKEETQLSAVLWWMDKLSKSSQWTKDQVKISGLNNDIRWKAVWIELKWSRGRMKWGNYKMGGDGGKDQESRCLFSVQSCEIERWNRKMKEQPAYASQDPFITRVIFNFQQLYQHLQLSLPKSHMTCSQPTIDKPYGVSLKGRFCFRWRNNWAGWAGGVSCCGVKVRDNTTAPGWTTHLLFSQRSWQQSPSPSKYTIYGLDTDPFWSEGIMGCHKYLPSCITLPGNTWNLQLWLSFWPSECECMYLSVLPIHCRLIQPYRVVFVIPKPWARGAFGAG